MKKPRERKTNVYKVNGKSLVAKTPFLNGDYLPEAVALTLNMLGGIEKSIKSGDHVMLKTNFNTQQPYPLSTELGFLAAVIEVLQDFGANVVVGEMCGRASWPTEQVIAELGVMPVLNRYGVEFVNFQYDDWIEVEVPGEYFKSYRVPRSIFEADKRVYAANMRCHSSARYTASLKLGVGWLHEDDREILHAVREETEFKAAEVNLAFQPDIALIDGRRSTVAWHGRGTYVFPNVIMASGDMVSLDTEAVKILKSYPEENRIQGPLESIGQITHAQKLGLGSMDYVVREAEANLETRQKSCIDPSAIPLTEEEKE
ncbi:MAG: DUF362 domain-containing protein [Anaerolineaceae bacterium]|nr:DUF362 domain-containing protein [Anaerolineaceae bacterium]